MYKVEFILKSGNVVTFDNISNIRYGKDFSRISDISEEEIMKTVFYCRGYLELFGDKFIGSFQSED